MLLQRMVARTIFVAAAWILAAPLSAQITGSVRGTVVDPADALVTDGTASLRSIATGAARAPQPLTNGRFSFDLLPVGNYEVRVEARGFRAAVSAVEVKVGEVSTLRFQLTVGTTSETITVTDAASPLDTENSQIQISFNAARVQEIPVGRNPNNLALAAPGVAPVTANNPFLGSGSFNVNGQRGRGNNITIDGITSTDVSVSGTGGPLNPLNFSSIQEVKVITNNFNAEYGRNVGSQVIYLTKSGTNRIRGEAYEYFKNNVLNARPFFDTSGKAAILRRNQYGFEVGGPFKIPGYNGADRTFWHTDWEQLKVRGASAPVIANVPTPAMVAQVTDPTAKALLSQYQLPTSPTGQANFQAGETENLTLFSVRADHHIGRNDLLWARFSRAVDTAGSAGLTFIQTNLPNFGATSGGPAQQASLGYTKTFSPVMVNEFRFGFGESVAGFPLNTPYPLGPRVQFSDASVDRFGLWEGLPQGRVQKSYQYSDNLSYVRGNHSFKFGGEWFHLRTENTLDSQTRGLYTFANWNDFATGTPQTFSQRFGSTTRGFRVNNIFAFAQDDWKVTRHLTVNLGLRLEWAGGPVEVNGKISNLNFNDRSPFGAAGAGKFGNFVVGQPSFHSNTNWAPRVGFAWTSSNHKMVARGGYGVAYDFIFMNPITNQRTLPPLIVTGSISGQANFVGNNSFAKLVSGTADIQTQTAAQVGTLSTTVLNYGSASPIINTDLRNPQTHSWNFGLEREWMGTVFKATYVGTKGNHLLRSHDVNLVANPAAPAISVADETARLAQFQAVFNGLNGNATRVSNRVDPRYNQVSFLDNSASSNYHALQFEAQRRFGQFFLNANWTWGKSLDNGSDALNVLINDSPNQQNPLDNRNNYGPSQFDLRHRLVISHSWAVPWLKTAKNPFVRQTLSGWNFAGITSFRTGFPVTLDAGVRRGISPLANIGGGAQVRPNAAGPVTVNWKPSGSAGSPTGLNSDPLQRVSAYAASLGLSQPLLGNFGTLGRNSLRLNGQRDFTWNVYKNFTLKENSYLQLRCELYNVFNNTAFQDVNRNITNTNFGQYTTVAQDARIIQLGARIVF
ncbi:MAG: carboxypeptidase regulatory-like domain-containing protein [Acidobacteriota bacterium]